MKSDRGGLGGMESHREFGTGEGIRAIETYSPILFLWKLHDLMAHETKAGERRN